MAQPQEHQVSPAWLIAQQELKKEVWETPRQNPGGWSTEDYMAFLPWAKREMIRYGEVVKREARQRPPQPQEEEEEVTKDLGKV
jgi:hypothetical protein